MQTALIHDFHYSTKEPDYWFELQTVTKMLLLKDPTPQKQNGELKNSIVYKKTTHFCPENRWSDSSTQGASRAIPRLSDSHILLCRCSPLQHNSIIPRSHETGWILAGILSLDQALGLYNFLRGGESQKNGYLQMINSLMWTGHRNFT